MLCMYNYVDKIYDVIIPYTHNTAHVMILPLEIIITSRMLEHYGASVSEVADNTEARSQ